RVLLASPDMRVLFERSPDDHAPLELARRYLGGADVVLVEGFKRASLPKVEVFRASLAAFPLYTDPELDPSTWVAIVTDDLALDAEVPVLHFQDTMWLQLLANLVWAHALVIPE
ncbi:MAG TPA: molybdopterin-guanine dinucleotide biosynthesis protein MobB, partial [Gemmatimonadales bacterium]|nr:molybdopterin-guanine dinucleotide biosynthesis protein MobB [Gemmatimonadales bacterium]